MTTPVNTFQDILNALEQNPELRNQVRTHILTEELLQLPAQFQLMRADVDVLRADVDVMRADMGVMRADVDVIRADMGVLRADVDELRADMGVLRADVGVMREDMGVMRADVDELKTRMNRVEGRLGNIEGTQYEENAVRIAVQLASLELGIEGPRVAFSRFESAHPNFNQTLQAAVQSGRISREESRDLIQADLIIYGQDQHHVVVEVSLGPNEDDIARALRRSEILRSATGERVTPAIATPEPHAALIQAAEARNTRVLDIHS